MFANSVSSPCCGSSRASRIEPMAGSGSYLWSVCQPPPMLVFCSGSLRTSAISGWPGTALKKRLTSIGAQRRAKARCCSGVSFWSRKKMTPCSAKARCTSLHWLLLSALTSTPRTSAPHPPVSLRTSIASWVMVSSCRHGEVRVASEVMLLVAEHQVNHGQPLEIVADRKLVGDAHAAMHLHRALAAELARLADLHLGARRRLAAHDGILVVDLERGHQGHRARFLGVGEAVDHAVLQHLELADRHAELLARLDVLERGGVDRIHAAGGLGAERHDGSRDRVLDHREGAIDLAQHRVGADRDLVEGELGGTLRVLRRVVTPREAFRLAVDDEQGEPLLLARAARGAGEHDDAVGGRRVVDHTFLAGERRARP